jgi:hypothetical protein
MGFTPPTVKPAAVAGAPYSAEEEYVHGDAVTKGRKIFRDSEGRVRTERPMVAGGRHYIVEIMDPVLGANWVLDTQHKVAHLMMPQPLPPPAEPAAPGVQAPPTPQGPPPPQPVVTVEQLGPIYEDGLKQVGSRTTTVYPDGHKLIGETWLSTELQVLVKSQMGEQLFRLAGIKRSEPLPTLFRVPVDYTIVEEKGTFVVSYQ